MFDDDRYGFGFGWFWHIGSFLGGLILVAGLVVVAVLLVRYLIVATRAAQIYVDAHTPAATPTATTTTTDTTPATSTTAAADATTKPAPRVRTPKTPPPAL
jgi:hypothetical protein